MPTSITHPALRTLLANALNRLDVLGRTETLRCKLAMRAAVAEPPLQSGCRQFKLVFLLYSACQKAECSAGFVGFLFGESVNKFIGHHNHHATVHFDLIQN